MNVTKTATGGSTSICLQAPKQLLTVLKTSRSNPGHGIRAAISLNSPTSTVSKTPDLKIWRYVCGGDSGFGHEKSSRPSKFSRGKTHPVEFKGGLTL